MDQSLCKLSIIYPLAAEEQILNLVLRQGQTIKGFTTWRAEGHGHGFDNTSAIERFRGRTDRAVLVSVPPRSAISALLERIRSAFRGSQLAFWVEPVEQFGDFK